MSMLLGVRLPRTRRSKSFAPTSSPLLDPIPLLVPMLMRSLERGLSMVLFELDARSRSFRVCSCSIFADKDLISFMKSWNC